MRTVIYWEQDSWGGVDTHLQTLLSSWPCQDDEFVILYNRGNAGYARIAPQLAALPNVRCVMIDSCTYNALAVRTGSGMPGRLLRAILYILQPLLFSAMVMRLTRLLRREGKFDVLLADNGGYPAAWGCLASIFAGRRAGIAARFMLVHHAATAAAPFMGWFEQLVDRSISRAVSGLICVSYATRASLIEQRWIDVELIPLRVIYNGVMPATDVSGDKVSANLRRLTAATDDDVLVGIVGRVEPYKGQEDLIAALTRLDEARRSHVRIVIIGSADQDEVARLKRLCEAGGVAGRVHFSGYVAGEPSDIMRQLDLLVVATRTFEGFGLTLAEAMSAGTPVLTTRVGAIPEFVDDQIGYLIHPDSPHEIMEALANFLDDREAWQQRAEAARKRIGIFSSARMANEYRQFFAERLVG